MVIHIGVKTCKFAVVTERMWRRLIRQLKHVQVSSAALLSVCSMEKVSVVDHTDAFTARSGAPR